MSEVPAFNLTPRDHELLAMTDEEFVHHDWEELKDIIGKYISQLHGNSSHLKQHEMISVSSGESPPIYADT